MLLLHYSQAMHALFWSRCTRSLWWEPDKKTPHISMPCGALEVSMKIDLIPVDSWWAMLNKSSRTQDPVRRDGHPTVPPHRSITADTWLC